MKTGAYTIETLVNDGGFDRSWMLIETLPTSEWKGKPIVVLSIWMQDATPDPGTYRCTAPDRSYAELTWKGEEAA